MNDTKVQRYAAGGFMAFDDNGRWIQYAQYEALKADHARIVAELDEKNDDLVVLVSKLEQREQELRILIAKYQRLHAADVGYDEAVLAQSDGVMIPARKERQLAMEALVTYPQEPTK